MVAQANPLPQGVLALWRQGIGHLGPGDFAG